MSNPPRVSERVRAYFRTSIRQLVWGLLVFTLLGYLGTWHWLLELFSHFRLQYLWCAILGGIAMAGFRDFRTVLIALVSLGINAAEVLPWYFGKPPAPAAGTTPIKLLLANVFTNNRDTAKVLELIAREKPDIIVLQEINDRWETALKPLEAEYPNFETVPQGDNFGIGAWSRGPAKIKIVEPGRTDVPSLEVTFTVAGKQVTLMATHPVPPVRGVMLEMRNRQLDAIATWARKVPGPCIVIGDLNMSLWSPYHKKFVRDSGLQNARKGFGVLPSWPTMIPFMKIPLDHCLTSPGIGVRAIRTGPEIGSDHLPLIVELSL